MKRIASLVIHTCVLVAVFSSTALTQPADTYRSATNKYYWKNRKPFEGYWQQDVYYSFKATLNDSTDIITGSEELTYYNNSPDTLYWVFFHLYQNAFQPGSYLDMLEEANHVEPVYGHYESNGLGTKVDVIK